MTPYAAHHAGLLNKYGVDLYIGAHEHSYERGYAIYRGQVVSKDYVNAGAPAYVVAGAAGVRAPPPTLHESRYSIASSGKVTNIFLSTCCVLNTVYRGAGPVALYPDAHMDGIPLQRGHGVRTTIPSRVAAAKG